MPRMNLLKCAGHALLILTSGSIARAGESPAYGPAPQAENWTICQVGGVPIPGKTVVRGPGGKRTYFSGVMLTRNVDLTTLGPAFGAFLAQQYGVQNRIGECATAKSRADAEKTLKYWMESDAKYNYGGEIIETDWQYSTPNPTGP